MNYPYFTSESVSEGHPDKICDQISDAIVDEAIRLYPKSRVAVETLVTINQVVLAGEVTCPHPIHYEQTARKIIKELGYTNGIYQFNHHSNITVLIHQQSGDISRGVDTGGAGDQGMMFGFATNETKEYMPAPIMLAHQLVERIDTLRKNKTLPYLRPDGKSEVKMRYAKGKPQEVMKVVIAVPHKPEISNKDLKDALYTHVVKPVLKQHGYSVKKSQLIVNGTGRWNIGGPASDTGVTGRKIIVDSYGAMARHGGGAFSGKDPTKVDRSGAYVCRYIAKNIVAHKLADKCEVQVAYAIGKRQPIAKAIETFGTEKVNKKKIEKFAWNLIDLSVQGIITGLNLLRPIYRESARYGHFGRNHFPWEVVVS